MFRMTTGFAAPVFVLLMGGTAHAALTADQVWQSWKDSAAMIGLEVSAATENKDGGALTLNGVTIAPPGVPGISISDMVLSEQSDGSVTITPGASIGLDLAGDTRGSANIVHDGLTLTAREDGDALVYDFSAAKLEIVYDTLSPAYPSFDGSTPPDVAAKGNVSMGGLTGSYSDTAGTNRAFGLALKAASFGYNTFTDDPMMELKQTTVSETSDVEISFNFVLPSMMSLAQFSGPADFATALNEGLAISISTTQGASTGSMSQESPYAPMAMTLSAAGGSATAGFSKDGMTLQSQTGGVNVDVTSDMMPVPVKIGVGPVEVALNVPVMAPVAQDYGLKLKISQLSINEEAWAMFDPGAALSRDAAELSVDVSGKTTMDLPGIMAADETGAMPPIPAPESLNIADLSLKVAGAALGATGAFTFDNSMGMPMPIGEANVVVNGANALIDGLIATGLLAQEDAMGARMMMGAFMSPGAGPDELTSKIEAKPGFEIWVNGQRIQ